MVGLICAALFSTSWNMIIAMVVGMALGMVIALVVTIALFLMLFGAMEIMVPNMLTGMVAGMIISMAAAMHEISLWSAMKDGALVGFLVFVVIYIMQSRTGGKVDLNQFSGGE